MVVAALSRFGEGRGVSVLWCLEKAPADTSCYGQLGQNTLQRRTIECDRSGWSRLASEVSVLPVRRLATLLRDARRVKDARLTQPRFEFLRTELSYLPARHPTEGAIRRYLARDSKRGDPSLARLAESLLVGTRGMTFKQARTATATGLPRPIALQASREAFEMPSEFVGRAACLADVRLRLDEVYGEGGVLLVTAGSGVGKSTFSRALMAQLADVHPVVRVRAKGLDGGAICRQALLALDYRPAPQVAMDQLSAELARQLATKAAIAVIDGLDRTAMPFDLTWLPRHLQPASAIVLFSQPSRRFDRFQRSPGGRELVTYELPALNAQALRQWLVMKYGAQAAAVAAVLPLGSLLRQVRGNLIWIRWATQEAARRVEDAAARSATAQPLTVQEIVTAHVAKPTIEAQWRRLVREDEYTPLRCELAFLMSCGIADGFPRSSLEVLFAASVGQQEESLIGSLLEDLDAPQNGTDCRLRFHDECAAYGVDLLRQAGRLAHEHALIARHLPRDQEYWVRHVTEHVRLSDLPAQERLAVAADLELIALRLRQSGGGALHGSFLAAEAEVFSADQRSLFVQTLRRHYNHRLASEGIERDEAHELLDLLEIVNWPGAGDLAVDVCTGLLERSANPYLRLRLAWFRYQVLDNWDAALVDLRLAAKGFRATGDELSARRCERLLALGLFDEGGPVPKATELLQRCIRMFSRRPDTQRDAALAHETLAVVHDARSCWTDASKHYQAALTRFEEFPETSAVDIARVRMNRAIAIMFCQGPKAASHELRHASVREQLQNHPNSQFAYYCHANWAVLALLLNSSSLFQEHSSAASQSPEKWLRLQLRQSRALGRWLFEGDPDGAIAEHLALAEELASMRDAWGEVDGRLNAGLIALQTDRVGLGLAHLRFAFHASGPLNYPVGLALAWAGLIQAGRPPRESRLTTRARRWCREHLAVTFGGGALFVPCYTPLAEPSSTGVLATRIGNE